MGQPVPLTFLVLALVQGPVPSRADSPYPLLCWISTSTQVLGVSTGQGQGQMCRGEEGRRSETFLLWNKSC